MNPPNLMKLDPIRASDLAAVRHRFWMEGLSVAEWAVRNSFTPATTYSLRAGRLRARRGEAHRIAVALGLKPSSMVGDANTFDEEKTTTK